MDSSNRLMAGGRVTVRFRIDLGVALAPPNPTFVPRNRPPAGPVTHSLFSSSCHPDKLEAVMPWHQPVLEDKMSRPRRHPEAMGDSTETSLPKGYVVHQRPQPQENRWRKLQASHKITFRAKIHQIPVILPTLGSDKPQRCQLAPLPGLGHSYLHPTSVFDLFRRPLQRDSLGHQ